MDAQFWLMWHCIDQYNFEINMQSTKDINFEDSDINFVIFSISLLIYKLKKYTVEFIYDVQKSYTFDFKLCFLFVCKNVDSEIMEQFNRQNWMFSSQSMATTH